MCSGSDPRSDLPADAERRQAGHGAQRQCAAAPSRSRRTRPGAWRSDHRADRRLDRLRCGIGCRRRHHPFGADDHAQAARRSRRRALSRRERDFHGGPEIRPLRLQGLGARRRRGVSRQRQCRGGIVARRHRPRSHHDRNLGRSGRDAQLPPDQGRIPTRPRSRWESRTSRRKTRRRAASPRSR